MADSKYATMSKDTLIAEIKTRRAANRKIPVDLRADEATLRAALDADDVDNGDFAPGASSDAPPAEPTPLPPVEDTGKGKLPPVSAREAAVPAALRNQLSAVQEPASAATQPSEDDWEDDSLLYRHKGDKLTYQVLKAESDPHNKVFKARIPAQNGHPGLFWDGDEKDFADTFEKA